MLSKQQIHHFQTFGFLVLRKVFDPDEIQTIEREFDHGLDTAYRDKPFDGSARHWVPMLGEETPYFAALLEDPRFCDAAEQLYGDDVIGMACDANRYVGDTRWHPDTGSLHQYGIKFAFYLDPVGPETGALRVLPGSHWPPYHNQLIEAREESRLEIPEVPAFVCASEPGDVVGFGSAALARELWRLGQPPDVYTRLLQQPEDVGGDRSYSDTGTAKRGYDGEIRPA